MKEDQEIKKLKEKLSKLEFITEFQRDVIKDFEQITNTKSLKNFSKFTDKKRKDKLK